MQTKNALSRYKLIDTRLNLKQLPPPTLQDLVNYVSENMETSVSVSTIQKDIYAMRYDKALNFNAPIAYDRPSRRYKYTEENFSINNIPVSQDELKGLEFAISILQQFQDLPAIKVFEDAIHKIALSIKHSIHREEEKTTVFLMDRPNQYLGIEFMSKIVEGIRKKREITLYYQPFGKESKKHILHPYFIKEYKGRMYLIAKDIHPVKASKFLTFAFDRIKDVIIMYKSFQEEKVDTKKYFDASIGISFPDKKPEKIELEFKKTQAQYLESQPLHPSQKVLKKNKETITLSIEVVINYELIEKVLGYGYDVKVIKPKHLSQQIAETAEKMVELYK